VGLALEKGIDGQADLDRSPRMRHSFGGSRYPHAAQGVILRRCNCAKRSSAVHNPEHDDRCIRDARSVRVSAVIASTSVQAPCGSPSPGSPSPGRPTEPAHLVHGAAGVHRPLLPSNVPKPIRDLRMNLHPVILCGGSGTRLWPLSRGAYPKQFLKLTSDHSMLQDTLRRLKGVDGVQGARVICNNEHRFLVAEQLHAIGTPPALLLLEPAGRNTAPAVAAAALSIVKNDPDGLMLVLASDHVIQDVPAFHRAIAIAAQVAAQGHLATFGIIPDRPETGYGYIQQGAAVGAVAGAFSIKRFVEKPDLPTAEKLLASGDHLWNSGMFLMRASAFLGELQVHAPAVLEAVTRAIDLARLDLDFCRLDADAFGASPSISIDYAVMEKTVKGVVVPVEMGWSDVGSWDALWDLHGKTPEGNVVQGDVVTANVANTFIKAEDRMVAAVGVEDLVIVETADAVLVASKKASQDVKLLVDQLKLSSRTEHLTHRRVFRPWGSYESIDAGERYQVKRITVNPGQKLSLQMHHHRAEHWIVVSGTAKVTRGDEVVLLTENQSTYIPLGVTHRLENPGKLPLQLIEVQSGSYLGEDDIVRFEDVYQRA
jgi:mannose-1-phosphate guanylyltransferase/mannose-6-phosphate isomerase